MSNSKNMAAALALAVSLVGVCSNSFAANTNMSSNAIQQPIQIASEKAKCGAGSCGGKVEKKDGAKAEHKCGSEKGEHKCGSEKGEHKCGSEKGEHKCGSEKGEHKCGGKKAH